MENTETPIFFRVKSGDVQKVATKIFWGMDFEVRNPLSPKNHFSWGRYPHEGPVREIGANSGTVSLSPGNRRKFKLDHPESGKSAQIQLEVA